MTDPARPVPGLAAPAADLAAPGADLAAPVDLAEVATRIRRRVLDMCAGRGQGYAGQGLALADVLAHLYFRVMRRRPDGSYLDRFVLSTGHSAIGLFAALGEAGLYQQDELHTYGQAGSRIEESPLEGTPGFEITAGSLGQGLSQAVGMALGERLRGSSARVYCLLSDGELQEGQVWEAAMSASHHRLGHLTVLIDNNNMQADGVTAEIMGVEPVVERFAAFGFDAQRIDGHDHEALSRALPSAGAPSAGAASGGAASGGAASGGAASAGAAQDRPRAVVLQTVPGKGVPEFERHHKVHYLRLEQAAWSEAIAALS